MYARVTHSKIILGGFGSGIIGDLIFLFSKVYSFLKNLIYNGPTLSYGPFPPSPRLNPEIAKPKR